MKYSSEFLLNELNKIYQQHNTVTKDLINKFAPFDYYTIQRRFGSMEEALKLCNIPLIVGQRKMISKERLVDDLVRVHNIHGYISKPLYEKHGLYNSKVVQRIFGSFTNMYSELNLTRHPSGYKPTDEELLDDIRKLLSEYEYINSDIIRIYGKFSVFVYTNRFGSINNLYKLLDIPLTQYSASEEELLTEAREIYLKYNILTKDIIEENSQFSISQYYRRFGNLNILYDRLGLPNRYPGDESNNSANYCIGKFESYLGESPNREFTFDWLRNPLTNRKLPIDAYFPKHNIAIEYNGPQHYQIDNLYTKTQEDLDYRQNLDKIKYQLIIDHGVNLVVVHFKDIINDEYISQAIKE